MPAAFNDDHEQYAVVGMESAKTTDKRYTVAQEEDGMWTVLSPPREVDGVLIYPTPIETDHASKSSARASAEAYNHGK